VVGGGRWGVNITTSRKRSKIGQVSEGSGGGKGKRQTEASAEGKRRGKNYELDEQDRNVDYHPETHRGTEGSHGK